MYIFILLALFNGILIGLSRTINGKLSVLLTPFKASLWNHLIGFLFLIFILLFSTGALKNIFLLDRAPPVVYLGGVIGVFFVAISSYVFPRLGVTKASLLIIAGQMLGALAIEWYHKETPPGFLKALGFIVIIAGIVLSKTETKKNGEQ